MSTGRSQIEHSEVERTRARLPVASDRGELRAAVLLLALFAVGAAALEAAAGIDGSWAAAFAVLAVLYALAGLVEFEVGSVYTDCSLPVLTAMLVALPPALVPWAVAVGAAASALLKAARGARHVSRTLPAVVGAALPVLAPAAVMAAAAPVGSWAGAGVLVPALAAYIVADLAVSMLFERLSCGTPLRLPSPADAWVYGIDLLLAPLGLAIALAADGRGWPLAAAFVPLAALLRVFADERRSRIDNALELSRAYRGTAILLGDVVEADDAYTGSHSRDVVELAVEVGRRLGLADADLRDLEFAALLHDVGKIAVPKAIINKPGSLDNAEWAVMKRHTIEGQRMLENVGGALARVGAIVRSTHEDYDGTGYPDGIAGEQIPIAARICSACDALSAMTTNRAYRVGMALPDAIAELRRCAGTQFDPRVIGVLTALLESGEAARVETAAPAVPAAAG